MGWSTHRPIGLIYYAPQHAYRGYTLTTNVRGGCYANLIDMEGSVCHRWYSHEGIGYAYLLANGHLLLRTAPPAEAGGAEGIGGSSGALLELDWESNVIWEYHNPMLHHDYERLPNGNTLLLLFELLSPDLTAQVKGGRAGEEDPERMFGDLVQEITPQGEVVYQWHSWEHLSLDEDVICPLEDRREWTHGNSLNVTPDGDLLVSFRRTSVVGIVERSSGEFRWKWGPGEITTSTIQPTWIAGASSYSTTGSTGPGPAILGSSRWTQIPTRSIGITGVGLQFPSTARQSVAPSACLTAIL